MIEITLAALQNLQCLMGGVLVLGGIAGFFAILGCALGETGADDVKKHLKTVAKVVALPALLCLIPGPKDIFKIRIALLEYQLASPENVAKSAEVIQRIGEKLECKYLGCDDKKDSKKESK